MRKFFLNKSGIVICLFVVGMLGICVQRADATLTSTWADPNTLTVKIESEGDRDALEVQVNSTGEAADDYTVEPNPPWSIGGITSETTTRKLLHLNRNPKSNVDEEITIKYKNNSKNNVGGKTGIIRIRDPFTNTWKTAGSRPHL